MITINPSQAQCHCCRRTTFGKYGALPYGGRVNLIIGALWEKNTARSSPDAAGSPRPVDSSSAVPVAVEMLVRPPQAALTRQP